MSKAEAKSHKPSDDYILITTHNFYNKKNLKAIQMHLLLQHILRNSGINWSSSRPCHDPLFVNPFKNLTDKEIDKALDIPTHNPLRSSSTHTAINSWIKWIYNKYATDI